MPTHVQKADSYLPGMKAKLLPEHDLRYNACPLAISLFSAKVNGVVSIGRTLFLQLVLGSRLLDGLILSMANTKCGEGNSGAGV